MARICTGRMSPEEARTRKEDAPQGLGRSNTVSLYRALVPISSSRLHGEPADHCQFARSRISAEPVNWGCIWGGASGLTDMFLKKHDELAYWSESLSAPTIFASRCLAGFDRCYQLACRAFTALPWRPRRPVKAFQGRTISSPGIGRHRVIFDEDATTILAIYMAPGHDDLQEEAKV